MSYLDNQTIVSLTVVNRSISKAARSDVTWESRMPTLVPRTINIRCTTAINNKKKATIVRKQLRQRVLKQKIETLSKSVADMLKFFASEVDIVWAEL